MNEQSGVQRELPKYRCHKEVWALKIKAVHPPKLQAQMGEDGWTGHLVPEDARYGPIEIDSMFYHRHRPKPSDYYVVYEDGYRSCSPAQAFESGYALIG